MIQSQETIILFIGVILAASLVIFSLSGHIIRGSGEAAAITADVQQRILSSFEIVQVHETNVYIRGVSGELNTLDVTVLLNGAPVDANITPVRDSGKPYVLEPGDTALITLPSPVSTTDCLLIDIDGASAVWGVCG